MEVLAWDRDRTTFGLLRGGKHGGKEEGQEGEEEEQGEEEGPREEEGVEEKVVTVPRIETFDC